VSAPSLAQARPSPNIWSSPGVYETLNRAADPEGLVPAAMRNLLAGGMPDLLVDVGCGSGFHLPALAGLARRVLGVEPHAALADAARRRVERARLADSVRVDQGLAQHLPLDSGRADVVFSHWAYFFGPGSEPGLAEVERVLRPGGLQVVVDLDVTSGTGYAAWFARAQSVDPCAIERFFHDRGFGVQRLAVTWSFAHRRDLEAVLAIEFPPQIARAALEQTVGSRIAVPTVLRWRRL
jgi:SAM-dependent methyltransferase